jgi:hypothetical protein
MGWSADVCAQFIPFVQLSMLLKILQFQLEFRVMKLELQALEVAHTVGTIT